MCTVCKNFFRNKPGEDGRAMRCHHELMEEMICEGYSPYRLGIQSMDLMKHKHKPASAFIKKLKSAVDPKGILAPGRYIR